MKKLPLFSVLCILLFCGCEKQSPASIENTAYNHSAATSFTQYTISKGQQFSNNSTFLPVKYSELKFVVKFDSSAIYRTINSSDQFDINKLYGFSDNNAGHHLYSARFGWRWSDFALRLFAYVYNNGVRTSKELGKVEIGTENSCSIKVDSSRYIFSLNNVTDTMLRSSTTAKAEGYKLYPYFGGNETAPHDINILIKEVNVN
jgi:hypothetical protein